MLRSLPFKGLKPLFQQCITLCHLSACTWVYLSSSLQSEVQLLGFLIHSHQSVLGRARSGGLFQDKVDKDKVHWNFCLSIYWQFLSSLTLAGISHTSPFSLTCMSEAVCRIYLMSVLVRKKNPVGASACLVSKCLGLRRASRCLPHTRRELVSQCSTLTQGQPAARCQLTGLPLGCLLALP